MLGTLRGYRVNIFSGHVIKFSFVFFRLPWFFSIFFTHFTRCPRKTCQGVGCSIVVHFA